MNIAGVISKSSARDAGESGGNGHSSGWMPPLDGLRGLAVLMVLIDHFGQALDRRNLLSISSSS
jgi:peptidoglycan/LPS O-acetylase OafA/YrhL